MAWIVLVSLLASGCALRSTPLRVGQTYVVQWPGVPADIVRIEDVRGSLAVCRSLQRIDVEWVCNFGTALYWARIVPKSETVVAGGRR